MASARFGYVGEEYASWKFAIPPSLVVRLLSSENSVSSVKKRSNAFLLDENNTPQGLPLASDPIRTEIEIF